MRIYLDFSKMGTQLQLLLWAQVLVPEKDDSTLCNQESKLILRNFSNRVRVSLATGRRSTYPLLICKVLQLQTYNLGADVNGYIFYLCAC